jgi:hypothetical protein
MPSAKVTLPVAAEADAAAVPTLARFMLEANVLAIGKFH